MYRKLLSEIPVAVYLVVYRYIHNAHKHTTGQGTSVKAAARSAWVV